MPQSECRADPDLKKKEGSVQALPVADRYKWVDKEAGVTFKLKRTSAVGGASLTASSLMPWPMLTALVV